MSDQPKKPPPDVKSKALARVTNGCFLDSPLRPPAKPERFLGSPFSPQSNTPFIDVERQFIFPDEVGSPWIHHPQPDTIEDGDPGDTSMRSLATLLREERMKDPSFVRWLRMRCDDGTLMKQFRDAQALTESYPEGWKVTADLSPNEMKEILGMCSPDLYTKSFWNTEEGKKVSRRELLKTFCYEMLVSPNTTIPSCHKRLARESYVKRYKLFLESRGPKYPWVLKGIVEYPGATALRKFMSFERWGHFLMGPIAGVAQSRNFSPKRVTLMASLTKPELGFPDLMYIDLDKDKKWYALVDSFCAEGWARGDTSLPLYPVFKEKYPLKIKTLLCPSPLNCNVGSDANSIPLDMAYRFLNMKDFYDTCKELGKTAGSEALKAKNQGQGRRRSFGHASSSTESRTQGAIQIASLRAASPMGPPPKVPAWPFPVPEPLPSPPKEDAEATAGMEDAQVQDQQADTTKDVEMAD